MWRTPPRRSDRLARLGRQTAIEVENCTGTRVSDMNIQYPLSWGPEVEGTPSIAALRASYAVVFSTDPSKRASARPSGRSDCTTGGIAKVCNFRPPEAVWFTSGVDTRGQASRISCSKMLNLEESTAQGSRDARAVVGDDDHADIRGLVTAIHRSVAGLPRSSVGDHHVDAHIAQPRIPLIGAQASRDPCVVSSLVMDGCWMASPPTELARLDAFSCSGA